MFDQKFKKFACPGDRIRCTLERFTFVATLHQDYDHDIDDDDCHNPDQRVTGCNAEQQQQLLAARKAYANDKWFYVGIVVEAYLTDFSLDTPIVKHAASLWGIECNYPGSDNSYLNEVANELLSEAQTAADIALRELHKLTA